MLLDTCAVLWLAFNQEQLTKSTLDRINVCERLYISTMSFWEIGIKVQKKKLIMPLPMRDFVRLYSGNASVSIVAPDIDIILMTLELQWPHTDPVDRIIVATAMKFDVELVTGDNEITRFYSRSIL